MPQKAEFILNKLQKLNPEEAAKFLTSLLEEFEVNETKKKRKLKELKDLRKKAFAT